MADQLVEDKDLGSTIASEIAQARNYDRSELASKRARAIEYLRGEMNDTPPRPNGSKQTDRTFADTVSWILPGVVRVFTASDQMVQYSKVREENDDWSRDASEYTNYTFFMESDGYRVLYNGTHDSLTLGNGVACSYWEPERIEAKTFRDKTEMEIAALLEEGWQPTGVVKPGKPRTEQVDDPLSGETLELETPTLTVKLQKQDRPGKICDETCKPENLLLNSTATTIENARFVAYCHDDKTRSDLMEMARDYGWDRSVIENLPSWHNRANENEVTLARETSTIINNNSPLKSSDPISLYECYIRADRDGDGIAELIQAWYAGEGMAGTLLGFDEWEDDVPFTDIPCYPVPHRWDAESVFDRTEDIQRVKTVLLRGVLDNGYAVALPMWEAEAETVQNPDVLANPRFGATIWRTKNSMQHAPIVKHEQPFVGDKLQAILGYMDEMVSKRTGVSRTTMALDPEALQNQTATAAQQQRDAGYSQIELIARNMAELGWSKFFKKRLKLAIKHQQVRKIPSKKEESGFREIDPAKWDPNMAVSINVGLGTGSRDRDMAMLNTILMNQIGMADRLAQGGLTPKALEFLPKIRKTAVQIAESAGLRDPEDYYPEITDEEVAHLTEQAAQQQVDPAIELERVKNEGKKEVESIKAELKQRSELMDIAMQQRSELMTQQSNAFKEQVQAEADLIVENNKRKSEMDVQSMKEGFERYKFDEEMKFKREELEKKLKLEQDKMANAVKVAAAKPKPKPNGAGASSNG
jgi:flagellar biosynthesis GTPase FlhF